MKLHKHVLATVLSSSLLWAAPFSAHAGFFDFLEPANLSQKMKNLIAKQKVSGSVNIFDVQIYDGLSAALKYKIQSEPSYVDGYYTRFDRYTLDADAKPGDMIGGNDLPIGFEIDSNSEIIFARQFKKQSDTFTALPYTAKNLPLSAEQAIKNLNPGDFVAFNGKLSAVLSLNASSPIGGSIATASASTHVYITGQFMIHTFRMPNNKLRLKLIALRSKGVGVNAGVNFGDFKIVGLKIIDNRIKSRINLDPVNFGLNKDGTGLFMLDYVFDLNNAQAAQSYNDLIHTKTKFKDLTFINPLDKDDTIKNDILSDLAGVEDIVNQDYKLPPAQRRVDRIFKGSNDSSSISSSFKFGLNVLRFEQGSTYAQNKVVHIDRDETEQHYILDTFQTSSKIKVLLGLFGDEAIVSANMLFSTDDNWKIQKPVAVTLGREIKMTNVSRRDFEKIQEHVKSVIPADEYAKIDWKNWDFSHGDRVNGSFKNEIFFQPDALKFFRKLSDDEAYDLLVSFIRANGPPKVAPHLQGTQDLAYRLNGGLGAYEEDLRDIAHSLSVAFDSAQPSQVRYEAFKSTKDFPIWHQYGGGFLLTMIPQEERKAVLSYEMIFSAKGVETISYRFGNFDREELYKSLMYIQHVITDQSFDLRLFTDSHGEFKVQ